MDGSLYRFFGDVVPSLGLVLILAYVLYKVIKLCARDNVGENVTLFLGCLASQFVVCAVGVAASALSAPDVVQWSLVMLTSVVAAWLTVKYFVSTTFQTSVAITAT
ncbi:MAG: hypothetical protein IKX88_10060 [Thermoguttaceae bacterium]|nr:hypothetical protein [Thermoguttaceae bacterium]